METQKVMDNKSITLVSAGIIIGIAVAFVVYSVNVSRQPTICDKLTEAGIAYFLAHWEPDLLENRAIVHQFRDFDEVVQLKKLYEAMEEPYLMFKLDKTYNVIWRTDSSDEGWVSIYFYTEPD